MKKRHIKAPKTRLILTAVFGALIFTVFVLVVIPLKQIDYEGLSYYSEQNMDDFLFADGGRGAVAFRLREKIKEHPSFPFIEKYEVRFLSFRHVKITVYERSMAGFVRFQDAYLYFDWNGVLVESSDRLYPGCYEITGLNAEYAFLGDKLPEKMQNQFGMILSISQFLNSEPSFIPGDSGKKLGTLVDRIHFSSSGVSVVFGDICVLLGNEDYLTEKLAGMADMLPELWGRSGTLYLNGYSTDASYRAYFK